MWKILGSICHLLQLIKSWELWWLSLATSADSPTVEGSTRHCCPLGSAAAAVGGLLCTPRMPYLRRTRPCGHRDPRRRLSRRLPLRSLAPAGRSSGIKRYSSSGVAINFKLISISTFLIYCKKFSVYCNKFLVYCNQFLVYCNQFLVYCKNSKYIAKSQYILIAIKSCNRLLRYLYFIVVVRSAYFVAITSKCLKIAKEKIEFSSKWSLLTDDSISRRAWIS